MNRRLIIWLLLSCLLASMVGCKTETPTPTLVPPPTSTPIPLPTSHLRSGPAVSEETGSPTVAIAVIVECVTATPAEEPTSLQTSGDLSDVPTPTGRACLQCPPDGLEAALFDLVWEWQGVLADGQWFEVQIRPDEPGSKPIAYAWVNERWLRVTSSTLEPGRYRWRVVVVRGDGKSPGEALYEVSEECGFTMLSPHSQAELSLTPPTEATGTPTTTPSPTTTTTKTWYPWPTASSTATATATATATPTATSSGTVTTTPPSTPTPTAVGSLSPTCTPTGTGTTVPPSTPTSTPTGTGSLPAPTATATGSVPTATATGAVPTATATETGVVPTATETESIPAPTATETESVPAPTATATP